jgi:hypothetical protein
MSLLDGSVGGAEITPNDYSRLDNVRGNVLPVVTELTMGHRVAAFNGQHIFPVVTIPKMKAWIPKFGKEAFKRYETLRGMGGDSNVLVRDKRDTIQVATEEHDAAYPIDYLEAQEANFNLQKWAGFRAKRAVELEMEMQIADIVQDLNNYSSTNKITLGDGVNPAKWSDYITAPTTYTSDPQNDVETAKEAVAAAVGIEPNCLFMGLNVFKQARRHPIFKELIKYTQKGIISLELMAEFFDIPNIYLGASRYVNPDNNEVFDKIWGNVVIVYYQAEKFVRPAKEVYAPEGLQELFDVEEPSFGFTVRREGNPYVFEEQKSAKVRHINYTDNFKAYMTWPDAGYIINDAV